MYEILERWKLLYLRLIDIEDSGVSDYKIIMAQFLTKVPFE